jgi:tetratricopeptide (TPR) repeat protein
MTDVAEQTRIEELISAMKRPAYFGTVDRKTSADELLHLSKKNNHPLGEAWATLGLGTVFYENANFTESAELANTALNAFERHDNSTAIAAASLLIGQIHCKVGNYQNALTHLHRAESLIEAAITQMADEPVFKFTLKSALNRLGVVYENLGDFPVALRYHYKSVALAESLNDKTSFAATMNNLAATYYNLGRYSDALDCLFKCLNIAEESGRKEEQAPALANIATIQSQLGEYTVALGYEHEALMLYEQLGDKQNLSVCLNNVGNRYRKLGDYANAMRYHRKSLALSERMGNQKEIVQALWNLGEDYYITGETETAKPHFQQALDLAIQIQNKVLEMELLCGLARTYLKEGDATQAAALTEKVIHQAESLAAKRILLMGYELRREAQRKLNNPSLAEQYNDKIASLDNELHGDSVQSAARKQVQDHDIERAKQEAKAWQEERRITDPKPALPTSEETRPVMAQQLQVYRNRADALLIELPRKAAADGLLKLADELEAFATQTRYQPATLTSYKVRAKALNALRRFPEAATALDALIALSKITGEKDVEADAYHDIALARYEQNEFLEAKPYAEQAAVIWHELKRYHKMMVTQSLLGVLHLRLGSYTEGVVQFEQALALGAALLKNESNTDEATRSIQRTLGNINLNLSNLHHDIGTYSIALGYAFKSLSIAEANRFPTDKPLLSIGNINHLLGDELAALEYFIKAEQAFQETGDSFNHAFALANLANTYIHLGKPATAMPYFLKALTMHQSFGDKRGEGYVMLSLSKVYLEMENEAEHLRYLHKARALAGELDESRLKLRVELLYAQTLLRQKNIPEAAAVAEAALQVARQTGQKESEQLLHQTLAEVYQASSEPAKAAHHQAAAQSLAATLSDASERKKAETIKLQYELEQAMAKIHALGLDTAAVAEASAAMLKSHAQSAGRFKKVNTPAEASLPRYEVIIKTFGQFQVEVQRRLLTKDDWQRKRARDVFKYLLIHHKKAVLPDELAEMVWQNVGSAPPTTIKTVISQIRKALEPHLEPYQPSAYLTMQDHAYILDFGEKADIDFLTFKSRLHQAASAAQPEKLALLESATSLYAGDFLKEDAFEEWSANQREQLKDDYLRALMNLAALYRDTGKPDLTMAHLRKIITIDAIYEPALDALFEILFEQHRHTDIRKLYDECVISYKKELSIKPPKKFLKFLT